MKVLSLFSGIGAFEKALNNLGIEFELVGFSEIDKYATKSYCAIHGVDESKNLGDITKINEKALPKDIDLITYGFPCQDISIAGKQKGLLNADGTQTRSGLFFEALRIIEETQPRVAIAENVKNLTGKKFSEQFKIVLESLEQAGYNNYWQVLNSKDFGVPQNRERVFIVSVRKDIDSFSFEFPHGFPLELRLKDILDKEVDERFFLKKTLNMQPKENYIQYDNSGKGYNSQAMRAYYQDGLAPTLPARNGGDKSQVVLTNKDEIIKCEIPQVVTVRKYQVDCKKLCECLRTHKQASGFSNKEIAFVLGVPLTKVEHWFRQDGCFSIPDADIWEKLKLLLRIKTNEFDKEILTFEEKIGTYEKSERHYYSEGISPTLTRTSAGSEKIIVETEPKAAAMRGRYDEGGKVEQKIEVSGRNYSNAITTVQKDTLIASGLIIRKMTPKECFRLMGFKDMDYEKAEKVNSNVQLYKQAGNSIVVPVLEHIFKALIDCGTLVQTEQSYIEA